MDKQKEHNAVRRLQMFAPQDGSPYHIAYSGGKDSDVIRILAKIAGVNHTIHHSLTSADAPETVRYVRSIPDIQIDIPRYKDGTRKTMWNLIPKQGFPPTRIMRYCCVELKEWAGKGEFVVTGVRLEESTNRAKNSGLIQINSKIAKAEKILTKYNVPYRISDKGGVVLDYDNERLGSASNAVQYCFRSQSTTINPIIDWTEDDVWEFLHHYGCEGNPLYQCGKKRVGCIGCPMATKKVRKQSFEEYPKYKQNYIAAFDRMLEQRRKDGKAETKWQSGEEVMAWWLDDDADNLAELSEDEIGQALIGMR